MTGFDLNLSKQQMDFPTPHTPEDGEEEEKTVTRRLP